MKLLIYIARRYGVMFASVTGAFAAIVMLLDMIDLIGDLSGTGAGFTGMLWLSLLAAPAALYEILPLIVVLSTVGLFLALSRSSELVVMRAAGKSAISALIAPVAVTVLIGLLAITTLNPIVAATSTAYDEIKARYKGQTTQITAMGADGLWLRQADGSGQTVIQALEASADGTDLRQVTFLTFAPDGTPLRRISARNGRLTDGAWLITDAKVWTLAGTENPEAEAQQIERLDLPSSLTAAQIRDSFGAPSSIPLWDLPAFVAGLKAAGFSARRHEVWFQSELSLPLTLVAMMLIGAAFTMRHQRGGRTGLFTLIAVMAGFALHFVRNFAMVLGETGQLPIGLAVWAPPLAGVLLALSLLLHQEDG